MRSCYIAPLSGEDEEKSVREKDEDGSCSSDLRPVSTAWKFKLPQNGF